MHKGTRLATTAGATVLAFVAMSGVAQADPVGDLTGGLTDTVGGVLNSATGGAVRISSPSRSKAKSSRSGGAPTIGAKVDGPVHADIGLRARSSPNRGTQLNASVNAGVRGVGGGDLVRADVSVGLDTCGFAPEECGDPGTPTPPPDTPDPGTPPDSPPPGAAGPSGAGPGTPGAAEASLTGTLPITGGPLGALTAVGLLAVLTGSAAVAGARYRAGRTEE